MRKWSGQVTHAETTTEPTSTLSQRKGRAPQPSITWWGSASQGGPPQWQHRHDSIRLPTLSRATLGGSQPGGSANRGGPTRLTVALGLKNREIYFFWGQRRQGKLTTLQPKGQKECLALSYSEDVLKFLQKGKTKETHLACTKRRKLLGRSRQPHSRNAGTFWQSCRGEAGQPLDDPEATLHFVENAACVERCYVRLRWAYFACVDVELFSRHFELRRQIQTHPYSVVTFWQHGMTQQLRQATFLCTLRWVKYVELCGQVQVHYCAQFAVLASSRPMSEDACSSGARFLLNFLHGLHCTCTYLQKQKASKQNFIVKSWLRHSKD